MLRQGPGMIRKTHSRGTVRASLYYLGRYEAALVLRQGLVIDPQDTSAWLQGLRSRQSRSGTRPPLNATTRPGDQTRRTRLAWTNKGHALGRLGQVEAARECYERVLELDSSDREWSFLGCEARFALRRWDAGFASLREAFERYPRDTRHDVEDIIDVILRLGEGCVGSSSGIWPG